MKAKTSALGCLLLAVTLAAAVPQPDDAERYWPEWRGPLMTGVAPHGDPPLEWSEDHNVAWKVEIPGKGLGTPVVWNDRIYVLTAIQVEGGGQGRAAASEEARESQRSTAPARPAARSQPAARPTASSELSAPAATPSVRVEDVTSPPAQRQRRRGRGPSVPEPEHQFLVMAIARDDGRLVWQQTATLQRPHQGKRDNNSYASGSAITDGERVLAFFGSRGLFCYDLDGNLQWQVDFGDMNIRGAFGEGATPALHGDTVVVTWDHQGPSFIVALDKHTGEELWRQDRDEIDTWATPLVVEHDGRTQVVTAGTNRVRSYDIATGELIWEGDGLTMNPIPSPVAADGIVYLTAGYRGNALRAVRLADASGDVTGTPAVLWEHNVDTPYVPSPLLYGDHLYFIKSNSAILSNIDVRTGEVAYGPLRLEGLSEIYASPVGAAERVYLLGRDGNALVIRQGPDFEVLARNALDDGFDASPAVVDREMYLRGYRYLYRISED